MASKESKPPTAPAKPEASLSNPKPEIPDTQIPVIFTDYAGI